MSYPTFEEWLAKEPSKCHRHCHHNDWAEVAWYARDAEIADLKRQLRQALAQVEIVDRALGDPGNTSSKVALDAYVQEKVDDARIDEHTAYCNLCILKRECLRLHELRNRAKVKP